MNALMLPLSMCGHRFGHHTPPPFRHLVDTTREVVSGHIGLARNVLDSEPERLHSQIPPCDPPIGIFHPFQPLESFMVRFQLELPSK